MWSTVSQWDLGEIWCGAPGDERHWERLLPFSVTKIRYDVRSGSRPPCNMRGRSKDSHRSWLRALTSLRCWIKRGTTCPQTSGIKIRVLGFCRLGILSLAVYSIIIWFGSNIFSFWVSYFSQQHNSHSHLKASCHPWALSCHCCSHTVSIMTIIINPTGSQRRADFTVLRQKSNTKQRVTFHFFSSKTK